MKRLLFFALLLMSQICIWADNELKEDFETGLPTSAPSVETQVTLASGTWRVKGVYGKKDNNSLRATMSSAGAYLITPVLCQPGSISLKHRASGNGKKLLVEKSTDGGNTWSEIGTSTISSSTPYGLSSYQANSKEEDKEVLIRFTCQNATIYVDDISISLNTVSGGEEGGEDYPGNPEPQDTIEWNGPHSVEHCLYVAPWGSDVGNGSWENPFYNLQMAVDKAEAGDTIYVRGGTYYPTMKKDGQKTTIRINKNGTPDAWFTVKTFPGEFPVLNFKDQPKKVSVRGIQLDGNYWHIYGLHITQAGDNGIKLEGSHNIIERCTFSYNDDTGLQLGFGHDFSASGHGSKNDGSWCAYNDIIDCDSYLNCDADNYGSDADGFACKMHNGIGNRFIRCRAWDNADDAWDLYETDFAVKLIECWAWGSGRADLFKWVQASGSFQGNGNGIKLGGNGTGGSSKGVHEAWRCIAFNNNKTGSVKGFDENSHKGGIKLVNCLAFGNGYDYMFEDCADASTFSFYNNVCLGRIEIKGGFTDGNNALLTDPKNAWKNNALTSGFSESDYVSLSEEDAKAPRAADGSLPTRFARLKSSSKLIDRGLDLRSEMQDEYPFTWQDIVGTARDLGPYEYQSSQPSGVQMLLTQASKLSLAYHDGNMVFTVPEDGRACIDILSLQGHSLSKKVDILATGGAQYSFPLTNIPSGIYILRLTFKGQSRMAKVSVL